MARRIVIKRKDVVAPEADNTNADAASMKPEPTVIGMDMARPEADVTVMQQRVRASGVNMADAVSAFARAAIDTTIASRAFRSANNSPNLSAIPREHTVALTGMAVRQMVDSYSRNPNVFTLSLESVEIDRNIRDLSTIFFFRFVVNGNSYSLEVPVMDSYRSSREGAASEFLAEGEPAVRRAMADLLDTQLMPQMLNVIGRAITERMRR